MVEEQKSPPPEKITLYKFVDDNYKLITGMAAFIALTAFSSQLRDSEAKTYLGGCALLAAGLFALELFFRLPFNDQHWRLALFELVMLLLTLEMGRYFFLTFSDVWGPFATLILSFIIFLGPPVLLCSALDWVLKTRTHMREKTRLRVSFSVFIGTFALLVALIEIKLAGHSFSIRIPKVITDLFSRVS